ncbi:MAG: hypothetical protein WAW75_03595 [Gallionella sp.]
MATVARHPCPAARIEQAKLTKIVSQLTNMDVEYLGDVLEAGMIDKKRKRFKVKNGLPRICIFVMSKLNQWVEFRLELGATKPMAIFGNP